MNKLEQRLEALANRDGLQDVGIVRPYPTEWDTAPYPPKFKAQTRYTFDGKGLLNQHIYYFKSQTGNVVSNDAIMARLFIGTVKGVVFEWFMKLSASSIKICADLEKLFLACFFEDDTEFQCQLSLQPSKRKDSLTKPSSRDFEHDTPLS